MPQVKISVVDRGARSENLVESRFVDVQSERRLDGATAKSLLQREFPDLGYIDALTKANEGWEVMTALKPGRRCGYHYVWRIHRVERA